MEMNEKQKAALKEKLSKMSDEEKQEFLKKIKKKKSQECLFCKIVKGEVPTRKVFETENFLAFLEIKPANPGHVIVIPKKHYSVLPQMPDKELAMLSILVKRIAAVVFEITQPEGISIRQRNGAAAGQMVPHVHFHIIPRYKDDNIEHDWEPKELSDEQFDKIQKILKKRLEKQSPPQGKRSSKPRRPSSQETKKKEKENEEEEEYNFKPRLP